ncbi:MAG TPA: glycosyltransferase [Anaerolineales bacterium]|nr:glycosyltransferase [Anaerolineales bacterium]
MANYLTHGIIISFIYFQAVVFIIILSNIVLLHRIRRHMVPVNYPSVSILVPARDEEKTIGKCIRSLLEQDYPDYEVIVLDDQSSDDTPGILQKIRVDNPRLNICACTPPPQGFTGKNWACAQLAEHAQGDLLLFTDADTLFQPQALKELVRVMVGEQADLITGYPRQLMESWGERLLVPFFLWAVLCFTPLWLAYRLRIPRLSSAVGQMMLFRRDAYQKVGGHAVLGAVVVEDIALARRIRRAGLLWRVVTITDLVSCRMYLGGQQALDGFTKNLFATFDFRLGVFLFVYLWLGALFLHPWIILAAKLFGFTLTASYIELAICIGLSVLMWCIPYWELKLPLILGLIYPITMMVNEGAALKSLMYSLSGRLSWKGRPLPRPKWRWL